MKTKFSSRANGTNQNIKTSSAGRPSGLKGFVSAVAPVTTGSRASLGMTLPEMMVAVGVGFLILAVVATVFVTSARGFAAMTNYVNMDANSRNALDHMTRDIRQAGDLTEFSSTHLKFALEGQTNAFLVYDWDSGSGCLTEWQTGNTTTNTLLTTCQRLAFSLYDSSFLPTTNILLSKGLSVNWTCSRTILGTQTNTEDMQQALIVMRNKPL